MTRGSDLAIVQCRGATLNLDLGYGIGYVIPKPVADLVNALLRALNLGTIQRTGGTPPQLTHLATLQGYSPKLRVCDRAI